MGFESPGGIDMWFPWLFGGVVAVIVAGWIVVAVVIVRNRRVFQQAGIDPTTARSQLAVRLIRGQAAARPPAASRLAELDDLRNRGLITPEEYATRRAEIIAGI
jgi:hypothetical protein